MIKRATIYTWAEWFERHEGVRISDFTIQSRLNEAGKIGEAARNRAGRVLRNAYFSEQDVRQACADLLKAMPQADVGDFFEIDGVRHGTAYAWSRELGIAHGTISSRLRSSSEFSVLGKGRGGNLRHFFPESSVRRACADLLRAVPKLEKSGFFVQEYVRHGSIGAWARELGISQSAIASRIGSNPVSSVVGRGHCGRVFNCYRESDIRQVCADLLSQLPQADEGGFIVIGDIRHGTAVSWGRELGISPRAISSRLRSGSMAILKAKDSGGHVQDFFDEHAVRQACAMLIGDLPQADKSGFFEIDGVRHGASGAWSRELKISKSAIISRLHGNSAQSKRGKMKGGQIVDFYPEPAILEACKDLIDRKKK